MLFHANAVQHCDTLIKAQYYAAGWRHIGLFTMLSDNPTKKENSFFECRTAETMLSESFPL